MIELAILKTIGNFLMEQVNEMLMNKGLIAFVTLSSGLFTVLLGRLDNWFAFPNELKYLINGVYYLRTCMGVVENWQSSPKGGKIG